MAEATPPGASLQYHRQLEHSALRSCALVQFTCEASKVAED